MHRRLLPLLRLPTLLALALGSITITVASAVYFQSDELPPFVIEKLPLPFENIWLHALHTHVVAAALALPACLLLLSKTLVRRAPRLHRWLGRFTGIVVLFALVPSGIYLSLFAKGGLASTIGFMLSGVIVAIAMVQGVRTARAGRYVAHRRFMLHVLAQLSVAVTSRTMLLLFDALAVDANVAYLVSLWLPVLGSAAMIEWIVRLSPFSTLRRNHEATSSRRTAHAYVPSLGQAGGTSRSSAHA
jgi:uncharacterized membrane protein